MSEQVNMVLLSLLRRGDALPGHQEEAAELIDALHAEAEALRVENSGLSERHDVLSLAFNEMAGELEAARGLIEKAIERAVVFDDGSDGADAESARSVVAILRQALTATPAPEVQAEQGERQEVFAYGSPKQGVPPILAETWKALPEQQWAYPLPLYTTPQPGPDVRALLSADDVRDACANAVSVFAEVTNADQCREVAEYMREVLLAQIAHRQAQQGEQP